MGNIFLKRVKFLLQNFKFSEVYVHWTLLICLSLRQLSGGVRRTRSRKEILREYRNPCSAYGIPNCLLSYSLKILHRKIFGRAYYSHIFPFFYWMYVLFTFSCISTVRHYGRVLLLQYIPYLTVRFDFNNCAFNSNYAFTISYIFLFATDLDAYAIPYKGNSSQKSMILCVVIG